MSENEKLKKDWYSIIRAIDNVCELEDSSDTSAAFSMLLNKKSKIEKELSKHYEIIQVTSFKLKPLNQPTECHYKPS